MARVRANGARVGRSSGLAPATVQRIVDERAEGRTLRAIADGLNDDDAPTGQGGKRWYAGSVRYVLTAAGLSMQQYVC